MRAKARTKFIPQGEVVDVLYSVTRVFAKKEATLNNMFEQLAMGNGDKMVDGAIVTNKRMC